MRSLVAICVGTNCLWCSGSNHRTNRRYSSFPSMIHEQFCSGTSRSVEDVGLDIFAWFSESMKSRWLLAEVCAFSELDFEIHDAVIHQFPQGSLWVKLKPQSRIQENSHNNYLVVKNMPFDVTMQNRNGWAGFGCAGLFKKLVVATTNVHDIFSTIRSILNFQSVINFQITKLVSFDRKWERPLCDTSFMWRHVLYVTHPNQDLSVTWQHEHMRNSRFSLERLFLRLDFRNFQATKGISWVVCVWGGVGQPLRILSPDSSR